MTEEKSNGVVKTNSAEIKRKRADAGKPKVQRRRVGVADLPKAVPRDSMGQVDTEAEVAPEQVGQMGGFDARSMIEAEERRLVAHGQKVKIGEKFGPTGWDDVVFVAKAEGRWPRGRVDIKSLQPPEMFPSILDVTTVPDGPALYNYLMQVHARDIPTKVECTYVEGSDARYRCTFSLPAKQQQAQQPFGAAPYPGPQGAFPPPPYGPGYTSPPWQPPGYYSPWQPPPQQQQQPAQQPPAMPQIPPPNVLQGMSPQDVNTLMAQQQQFFVAQMETMRQQMPGQPQPQPFPAQQPDFATQFATLATAFAPIITPLLTRTGVVQKPLLEQVTELAGAYKLIKEAAGLGGEEAKPELPIEIMDGPSGMKIPVNRKDGEINKPVAVMMGIGTAIEEAKSAVGSITAALMMRQEQQGQQAQTQQMQAPPSVPSLPAPQQQQQQQQQQAPPVDDEDDNDPFG